MLKLIPKRYFASDDSGLLRILEEDEWRGIGITQSLGWEHFEVHGKCRYAVIYVQGIVVIRMHADKRLLQPLNLIFVGVGRRHNDDLLTPIRNQSSSGVLL